MRRMEDVSRAEERPTPGEPGRGSPATGYLLAVGAFLAALGALLAAADAQWLNAGRAATLAGVLGLGALGRLRWAGRAPLWLDLLTLALAVALVALLLAG